MGQATPFADIRYNNVPCIKSAVQASDQIWCAMRRRAVMHCTTPAAGADGLLLRVAREFRTRTRSSFLGCWALALVCDMYGKVRSMSCRIVVWRLASVFLFVLLRIGVAPK
jgi:hypothetical protein